MDRKIRIVMAKPGLDGHDRGIKVLASAYRDAGMEVIYLGLRQTPEMIVSAAIQEDADVIALSVLSGAHMTVFPKVMDLMKENEISDVLLTGGGIIADKIIRHELATASIVTFGVFLLWTVPFFQPNSLVILLPIFILFGFSYGMAQPSRDMVVRSVAPSGVAGKVFGFTYSGMDFGSAIVAMVFGFLLSEGEAQMVFILVGIFMMLGVMSVLLAKFTGKKPSTVLAE